MAHDRGLLAVTCRFMRLPGACDACGLYFNFNGDKDDGSLSLIILILISNDDIAQNMNVTIATRIAMTIAIIAIIR